MRTVFAAVAGQSVQPQEVPSCCKHIGVAVADGIVTLTGHVPSYAEKYAAERAAKRVYGVKAVADELDVKLPGSAERTDEDIAAACVNALRSITPCRTRRLRL